MGLRYTFRHLFFGNRFHKERMWNTLEDLDARIEALEGGESTQTSEYDDTEIKADIESLKERVSALETPSEP